MPTHSQWSRAEQGALFSITTTSQQAPLHTTAIEYDKHLDYTPQTVPLLNLTVFVTQQTMQPQQTITQQSKQQQQHLAMSK